MYILCVYIYLQAADKRKTRSSIMIEESEDMEDDRRRGQMFPNPPKKTGVISWLHPRYMITFSVRISNFLLEVSTSAEYQ